MREVAPYARSFFDPAQRLSCIGGGELGGKAHGLRLASEVLHQHRTELEGLGFRIDIPSLVILGTDFFDSFLERNSLLEVLAQEPSDELIAQAFHRAALPAELVGDLRALSDEVRVPLAVRSSSLLEDALGQPFAGVYGTKMVPANQASPDARFRSLVDAVKFVWASTFSASARAYLAATPHRGARERMAVILQEVVGRRHDERFYPDISGVARSYNFYPLAGAEPAEGVVSLAAGLGKTIVDGGLCWQFAPTRPRAVPPFGSVRDLLHNTQTRLWAVNVGAPPPYDPMAEAEYLLEVGLDSAERDGTLRYAASTFDPRSERLWPGLGRAGPRVLDFAPLLVHGELPLVGLLTALLRRCEAALGAPVEVEFALSLPAGELPRFGFLQVRPLLVSQETVEIAERELASAALVASRSALGNGRRELADVVYVEPATFEARLTPEIALEIERLNRDLVAAGRPYLLIGFGRWGSSEPWLGIPVRWDQIAGARAMVEASLPQMSPEPSQGSHFFHNLSSFAVLYLSVPAEARPGIDWQWLAAQPEVARTPHVRHVRCAAPLRIEVDGRTRRGLVRRAEDG